MAILKMEKILRDPEVNGDTDFCLAMTSLFDLVMAIEDGRPSEADAALSEARWALEDLLYGSTQR